MGIFSLFSPVSGSKSGDIVSTRQSNSRIFFSNPAIFSSKSLLGAGMSVAVTLVTPSARSVIDSSSDLRRLLASSHSSIVLKDWSGNSFVVKGIIYPFAYIL